MGLQETPSWKSPRVTSHHPFYQEFGNTNEALPVEKRVEAGESERIIGTGVKNLTPLVLLP